MSTSNRPVIFLTAQVEQQCWIDPYWFAFGVTFAEHFVTHETCFVSSRKPRNDSGGALHSLRETQLRSGPL